jgi:hypothetical protein
MTFVTQVQQVMRRDFAEARWALAAYAATLAYVAWEGRRMLSPPPFPATGTVTVMDTNLPLTYLLVPIVTVLLAAFIALAFAPMVGPARSAPPPWRTLPIAPAAVWSARLGWFLLAGLLVFAVGWWSLLPMPLPAPIRVEAATTATLRTLVLFITGALLAMAATSLRALAIWVLTLPLVALLALQLLLALANRVEPGAGVAAGLPGGSTAGVLALLAVALFAWGALLHARHLGWPGRVATVSLVLYLLLANMARVSPALPAPAQAAQPSLVADASLEVSLREFQPGSATLRALPNRATTNSATPSDPLTDPRVAAAMLDQAPPPEASPGVQVHVRVLPAPTNDRIVWRERSSMLEHGTSTWPFTTTGTDIVIAAGTPLPDRALRALNAPPPSVRPAFNSRLHKGAPLPGTPGANARLTLDVERQQPTLLALVPLDGRPATGPWRAYVRARFDETPERGPSAVVRLTQVQASRLDGRTVSGARADVTFVLVHDEREELAHLDADVNYGGEQPWALAPGLLHTRQSSLRPTPWRAPTDSATVPTIDAAWVRGASLAVIGWRAVERGTLTLEAPVAPQTALRRN